MTWWRWGGVAFPRRDAARHDAARSGEDGDEPDRAAAAPLDLHGQGDCGGAADWDAVEIGHVLQAVEPGAVEGAVGEEVARGPVIEAGGVDPDAGDLVTGDQPLGRVAADAGEVEMLGVAGDIAAEIGLLLG